MEVFSKIILIHRRRCIGPISESRRKIQANCIPDNPFEVIDGIEGLLRARFRLLDARELGHVPETMFAISRPDIFPGLMEGASILCVAFDSLIENTLYSVVVFSIRSI